MPTAESVSAFAKLVETRNRLTEITKQLNQALSGTPGTEGFSADAKRYRDLQAEWDAAFHDFEASTEAFTTIVKQLRGEADARQNR
jgi:hypothetical protein